MTQATNYKRSFASSVATGMKSVFGSSGRRFYELEHRTSSEKHYSGEVQKIIVDYIELGRDKNCQVHFGEDCKTVSRRHAAIVKDGNGWKLVQLSKTNSTYLNGRKIATDWYLQNGDEIQLSTGGPRLGFLVKEGAGSLVRSINLTARLSLFRQQALKPYKRALAGVAAVLVAVVVVGVFIINTLKGDLDDQQILIAGLTDNLETEKQQRVADSIRYDQMSKQQKEEFAKEIQKANARANQALNEASRIARESGSSSEGIAAMIEQQHIDDNVFFFVAEKVVYISPSGEEYQLKCYNSQKQEQNYGWIGTGFLLDDGKFVTARHCVEGWLYSTPDLFPEGTQVLLAKAASGVGRIKAYYSATSSNGTKLRFNTDNFRMNHSLDRTVTIGNFSDGSTAYWKVAQPVNNKMPNSMWTTDWATVQTSHSGGLVADQSLCQTLLPAQTLLLVGFPHGHGKERVTPLHTEVKTTLRGLDDRGCLMYSQGSGQGNSGGPVLAIKDGKLVVVAIVSHGEFGRGDVNFNWGVPISKIF